MAKKIKKPKIKMRSYGGGKELPTVKSKEGLFKKPEFFLIGGDYYDPESNTKFSGESTTPIKGPSKRAIKGKGKRSGEAYLEIGRDSGRPTHADDFAAMENITPIQQKYSSQSGMESAVKRWQSPHKLTGDPGKSTFNYADKSRAKTEKEKYGVTSKKGEKEIAKEKRKADKEAYRKSDEFKEKRAKTTDTVQAVGRAMMAFSGLTPGSPGESAVSKLKKEREKASSESAAIPKTKTHSEDSEEVLDVSGKDKGNTTEIAPKASPKRRGDIEAMSAMMRKIKNPRKVEGDGASAKTPKQRKISEKKYNRKLAKADKSKIKQTSDLDAHKRKRTSTESTIVPNKKGTKNFVHETTTKSTYHPEFEMNLEDSREWRYYKQRKK